MHTAYISVMFVTTCYLFCYVLRSNLDNNTQVLKTRKKGHIFQNMKDLLFI